MFSSNVKGKNMCVYSGCHFFSDSKIWDLTYRNLSARRLLHLKSDKMPLPTELTSESVTQHNGISQAISKI